MGLQNELRREVATYRAATYAASTKRSYATHLNKYFSFCSRIGVQPVPASSDTIAQYAAFLARTIKASSVRVYLNVIRVVHLESGHPNPLSNNWYVQTTLKGIDRILGEPAVRRTPIHPSLLMSIRCLLDLANVADAMFWAAALVMFYGLLRKGNLFPDTVNSFNPRNQFTRSDFTLLPDGSIVVNVKYSKTNQFHSRSFQCKLIPTEHPLSAPFAIHNAFRNFPLPAQAPAFVQSADGSAMTGVFFNAKFKTLIADLGIECKAFSSHSFRRGGACWALQCGVPGEIVQQLGDWRTDVYKQYLDQLPQQVHDHYRRLCVNLLPTG